MATPGLVGLEDGCGARPRTQMAESTPRGLKDAGNLARASAREMAVAIGDTEAALVRYTPRNVAPASVRPSGNRRWHATVEGTVAGRPRTDRFRLDLAKRGNTPTP